MDCILIISQYRHSRHSFIVKRPEDTEVLYAECCGLVSDLEDYKRDDTDNRPHYYGDVCGKYFRGLHYRCNVNDVGDILPDTVFFD